MRPLVQGFDGDLVAFADLAEHVRFRHHAIFENELVGARCADAELVFFFPDGETFEVALDDKRGNAFVARVRIHGGEDDEQARFSAVGNPQLGSREPVPVAVVVLSRAARERERVAPGIGLGKCVGADGVDRKPRQVAFFLFFRRPAHEGVVDERVLDVDANSERRVHA